MQLCGKTMNSNFNYKLHRRRKRCEVPGRKFTHGPPHGILDLSSFSNRHAGSPSLLKKVQEINPKLHIFGYLHECLSILKINQTQFMNATICDGRYRTVNKPLVIEIYTILTNALLKYQI